MEKGDEGAERTERRGGGAEGLRGGRMMHFPLK
jgi:hypothetical protein